MTKLNHGTNVITIRRNSLFLLLAVGSLMLVGAGNLLAITSTATGGLWSATGTWVGGIVPSTNDDVVIANTSGQVTVDTTTTIAKSVTINSGSTLGIGTSSTSGWTLTVAGNLTNNGTISTGPTGFSTSPTHTITFATNSVTGNTTSVWVGSGDISVPKCALSLGTGVTLDISGLSTALKFHSSGSAVSFKIGSGTLIAGTQVINGNGAAGSVSMSSSGATIQTANPNGLINGTSGTFNWTSAASVGLSNNATYVFNGSAAQVTTGLPATVKNLVINNNLGVTLSQATTVTNLLTLTSGALTTTAGNLLTVSSGTISGGSVTAYVNGPLAQVYAAVGTKNFPVGTNAASVNLTTISGTPTITVTPHKPSTFGGTTPASTTMFAARDWTVASSVASGNVATVTVDGSGFAPVGTGTLVVYNGSSTTTPTTIFSSPNYSAANVSLTASSDFALGDYLAGVDQLAFITTAQTNAAGVTSGTITVQLQDTTGTPKTYATNLTLNLSATSGTGIFRDAGDTTTVTSVTLLAGNNSVSFKYNDTKAGNSSVSVSAGGLATITQIETTTSAAASALAFTIQPANAIFGAPLAAVAVQIQDAFGNNVSQSGTGITIALNGAALTSGTVTQNTDATGKANFGDLVISTIATGLNFTATASGLAGATSGNFNVAITTVEKAANNTALNVGSSWNGGATPGIGNLALIDNASVTTTFHAPDVGGSASWYGLIITNWSANTGYTIGDAAGNSVITLGAGGILATNSSHTFNFNAGLAFGAAQTWNWLTTQTLTLGEPINNNGFPLVLNGGGNISFFSTISGSGGLTNNLIGTVTFTNQNTYTGPTVVSAGAKIAGDGVLSGPVIVQTGASIRAGLGGTGTAADTTNALTINNNLTLNGGTFTFYINRTNGVTASKIAGVNTLSLGCTLNPINNGAALQAGDSFTIFQATNYVGGVTNISYTTAGTAIPLGVGLLWSTNNLAVNGSLAVAGISVSPAATNLVYGNSVVLSVAAPAAGPVTYQWFDNATNAIGGGTSSSLTLTTPPVSATGNYTIVVSNPFGSATNVIPVTIAPAPAVPALTSSANPAGYLASVNVTATLPADATGSVTFTANGNPFSTNGLSSGSATSLALNALPRGTNLITVVYAGDANYSAGTNSFAQIVTNHPPVAANLAYPRYTEMSTVRIAISDLLAGATDADSDAVTFSGVATSTNGITLGNSAGYLLYTNAAAVNDQFTYTLSDGFGGTATGTVTLNATGTSVFGTGAPVISVTGTTASLTYTGIPGLSYSVLRSPDLTSWTVVLMTNAPAGGGFNFTDSAAPQPNAFYRLQFNP